MVGALERNLHIIQWNARSIKQNISDFTITLYTTKPDVAAIQETHLKPNSKFKPENSFVSYDIIRKDRLFRKAGGLMIVIRKDLIYNEKILQPYPNGKLEVQVVTIKEKSYDLDIMNVYNAPNNTIDKTESYTTRISFQENSI